MASTSLILSPWAGWGPELTAQMSLSASQGENAHLGSTRG